MQPYSTYNTATLVLLRHRASGLLLQCCAVYPNWDPTIEPVKVLSLRYAHSVIQEQFERLVRPVQPEQRLVLAGDLNIRPISCSYQLLSG